MFPEHNIFNITNLLQLKRRSFQFINIYFIYFRLPLFQLFEKIVNLLVSNLSKFEFKLTKSTFFPNADVSTSIALFTSDFAS